MCQQSVIVSVLHRQVSLLAIGVRQGASRGGCVWLWLTLWGCGLALCLFRHSQTLTLFQSQLPS